MNKKIWANTIVYNEENFIWFAVMSVVDYVDKILIWDTGSTDKTMEIIKEIRKIKGNKIQFKEVGAVDKYQFTKMRQAMLEGSKCDWIFILDGDEIWWQSSIKKVIATIQKEGERINAIIVPFYNVLGDIYHYQDEKVGRYKLLNRTGNLTIRAINKNISGLHVEGPYGKEGFVDGNGIPIQQLPDATLRYLGVPYLHCTYLVRSSIKRGDKKIKYEFGKSFLKGFKYPEVLYQRRPKIVDDLLEKRSMKYLIKSLLLLPALYVKRSFYKL